MSARTVRRTRAAGCLLAAGLALCLGSCSSGSDDSPDFGTNDVSMVVALGDSITFGYGDTGVEVCDEALRGAGGFCPRLEAMSGKTVVNLGFCGADSYDGVSVIEKALKRYKPAVILIDFSPNDIFHGTEVLISNLRTMIITARNNKTVPILGTMTPSTGEHSGWLPFIRTANAAILQLCHDEDVQCADHYQAFVSDPGFVDSPYALLVADGLHPNSAGYQLMAKTWLRPLQRTF